MLRLGETTCRGNFSIVSFLNIVNSMKSKLKTREKKNKRVDEMKLNMAPLSPERKVQKRKTSFADDTIQLNRDVKTINKKLEQDGEVMFFERLPQKIIELTEYMKVWRWLIGVMV